MVRMGSSVELSANGDTADPVPYDAQLVAMAAGLKKTYAHEMDTFAPHNALSGGLQGHPAGQQVY